MTSDRVTDRGADLNLNTPVTKKSPGLNPNASVFLSKTPPNHHDNNQWEEESSHSTESSDAYQLVNGDVGKSDVGPLVYPPTPESPVSSISEYPTAQETTPTTPVIFPVTESNGNTEENGPLEGQLPEDELRGLLRTQLEYYFSRDNLSHDTYLVSQMDSDQYVPILTVANFNQVKRLTNNMELIVSVLRELANVQVDEKGERVRPNHNRCIVILREVPASTPLKAVEELFSGENCPKFVSCEFAHNDNWYVTFESDETAQRAYQYLREDVKTFLGKPIMARIKAKTFMRTVFRNGVKPQNYEQPQAYSVQQQQQPAPQSQQQRNYNYAMPLQYMNGGQQPFQFPSYNTIMAPTWPPMLDPSMVFAINGYQAQSVKINQNAGRHAYPSSRPSRGQKLRGHNPDRGIDNRMNHERYGGGGGSNGGGSHRTSPRSLDGTQPPGGSTMYHAHRDSGSGPPPPHIHHPPIPAHLDAHMPAAMPMPPQSAQEVNHKDGNILPQRGQKSYRSRRRRDEEGTPGARNSRTASQISTKDSKSIEPQFELESNSFPPLPGSSNNSATGDIFENKLSDVVKGTTRPGAKEAPVKTPQQSVVTPSSPTAKEMSTAITTSTSAVPISTSNNNNNNMPNASATTTSPVTSSSTTSSSISVSQISGTLPTPPPSPEKMETEHKYEPRLEKSQKMSQSHTTHHSSHSQSQSTASNTETKSSGRHDSSSSGKQTNTPQRSASFDEKQPAKLSYAQMVQRRAESENGTMERSKSEESAIGVTSPGPTSSGPKDQASHKPHTLKEQSQTARQTPANSRLSNRDNMRKETDPKEQRPFVNRRAKENRERRVLADRRREREFEFEGRRSPNK